MSQQFDKFVEVVKGYDFVVLDTETTGLRDGEICQIAIINQAGHVLIDTLVKPSQPIPLSATSIHGITNDMVADAPTWSTVSEQVFQIVYDKNVIVYNAKFDRMMMHLSAEKAGIKKIDWKAIANFYCAMEAFAEYRGEWDEYHGNYRWARLDKAMEFCGISGGQFHTAIDDCYNTLQVISHMAYNPPRPF